MPGADAAMSLARWRRWLGATTGSGVVVPLLGMAAVIAVWLRYLATPGEVLQGDTAYSLGPGSGPEDAWSLWHVSHGSNLAATGRVVLMGVPYAVANLFGVGGGAVTRAQTVGFAVLGFLAAYLALRAFRSWDAASGATPCPVVWACGLGALVYVVNPFVLAHAHQLYFIAGYYALPAVVGLLVLAYARGACWPAVCAGVVFGLFGSSTPHYVLFTAAALAMVVIVQVARRGGQWRTRARETLLPFGLLSGIWLALYAPGWLPLLGGAIYGDVTGPDYAITGREVAELSASQTALATLSLASNHNFSSVQRLAGGGSIGWQLAALVPIAALAWVALTRWARSPSTRALVVLAALTAFQQAASAAPALEGAYQRLAAGAPFGWVFREADRSSGLLALPIAWGVASLAGQLGRSGGIGNRLRPLGMVLGVGTLASCLALWAAPSVWTFLWDREAFNWLPAELPAEYYETVDWINHELPRDGTVAVVVEQYRDVGWASSRRLAPFLPGSLRRERRNVFLPDRAPFGQVFATIPPAERPAWLAEQGVGYVLVVGDSAEGRAADEQFAATPGFEVLRTGEYLTVWKLDAAPIPRLTVRDGEDAVASGLEITEFGVSDYAGLISDARPAQASVALLQPFAGGWALTIGGQQVAPELLDGWAMRFPLPEGASGDLRLEYRLESWFRLGLIIAGGALAFAGMVGWMELSGRWRPIAAGRARAAGLARRARVSPAVAAVVAGVLAVGAVVASIDISREVALISDPKSDFALGPVPGVVEQRLVAPTGWLQTLVLSARTDPAASEDEALGLALVEARTGEVLREARFTAPRGADLGRVRIALAPLFLEADREVILRVWPLEGEHAAVLLGATRDSALPGGRLTISGEPAFVNQGLTLSWLTELSAFGLVRWAFVQAPWASLMGAAALALMASASALTAGALLRGGSSWLWRLALMVSSAAVAVLLVDLVLWQAPVA